MFRSLRIRMALSHGAVLAAIVFLLGGTAYVLLDRSFNHAATADLVAAARAEADHIAETGVVRPPLDNDLPSSASVRIAVFTPDGTPVGEPRANPSWLRPTGASVATIHALGEEVRVASVPVMSGGRQVATVVAGRSLVPEDRLLARLRLLLVVGGIAAVGASMVAGWFLAGRAARPVRRAYEAQASFAADASHELRSPLAFVRSGVEVLAEHDPDLGGEVLGEVDYLTGLTDRLLTLARAQSGRLSLTLRRARVRDLLERAAARQRSVHNMTLGLEFEGDPSAVADPIATEAALDAILENVATHAGGIATIRCRTSEGEVHVEVADHGPGLTQEQRRRAFERFFRADPVRGHEDGGAGLGLALARSLIEAQSGRVWLEETPGGGLTAMVALRAAAGADPREAIAGEGADTDRALRHGVR